MGVSVWGHTDRHLHSLCPQCGYATQYKQWSIRCACSNAQRQNIRTTPDPHVVEIWSEQERKKAELRNIDHQSHPASADRRPVCRWEA
jgi:predicted nucleic-acid-binding Zn-ribbon protein